MIPIIKEGIISSIIPELEDPNWVKDMFIRLWVSNPVLAEYLSTVRGMEKWGEKCALTGLMVIRIIESQMEVDELEELLGE